MKYSKASRDAFNAERARQTAYWMECVEDSFRFPFSWSANIKDSKYRRTPASANNN